MHLLFHTFGLTAAIIAPVLIFCFLGLLLIPLIRMVSLWKKTVLNISAGLVLLIGVIGGQLSSNYTKDNPLQTFLAYTLDADNQAANWVTHKQYKNEWMQSFFNVAEPTSLKQIYPNWDW